MKASKRSSADGNASNSDFCTSDWQNIGTRDCKYAITKRRKLVLRKKEGGDVRLIAIENIFGKSEVVTSQLRSGGR